MSYPGRSGDNAALILTASTLPPSIQGLFSRHISMDPKRILSVVSDDFKVVNDLILGQLHSDVNLVETISEYLIESGGKRVRPLLVLLTARCCGYTGDKHTLLATIIEFLHTATLLHDDVVDTSKLRRGRSTANVVWGNAPSVLVGDFLYSRAFQMMVKLGDLNIMSILANSTNLIAEGEVQQLTNARNADLSETNYREVIKAKTAVLFEASSHTSAVLAGVAPEKVSDLRAYGSHLGMTFQLIDDLLDYNGDADKMGKNVGDDLAEGKVTLPLIYAMQNCSEENNKLIRDAVLNNSADNLERIIELVKTSGALEYTQEQAAIEAQRAVKLLDDLPDNIYRQALCDLVQLAADRSN